MKELGLSQASHLLCLRIGHLGRGKLSQASKDTDTSRLEKIRKLITVDVSGPCLGLLGQRRWDQVSLNDSKWGLAVGRGLVVGDDRQTNQSDPRRGSLR